jgi:hypothetical protein
MHCMSPLLALRYRDQRVGFTVAIGGAADKGRLAAFAGCVENDPKRTIRCSSHVRSSEANYLAIELSLTRKW